MEPCPEAGLSAVQRIVHLMVENRSFDHMLGFLYGESGNVHGRFKIIMA